MITVKLNSVHKDVATLQKLLTEWGYPVRATGVFSPATDVAARAFQKDLSLTSDGIVGPGTWAKLQDTAAKSAHLKAKGISTLPDPSTMPTLKQGANSDAVKVLQQRLTANGYAVSTTGNFGTTTHSLVVKFQKAKGLTADGIVGQGTWKLLLPSAQQPVQKPAGLTEADLQQAAKALNVEVATIKAVREVETGNKGGFLDLDTPPILFEGHIFWTELKNRGVNPANYSKANPDIVFYPANKKYYTSGFSEYSRLVRAIAIHPEAALASASWGFCQILGNNYKLCKCTSPTDFVLKMMKSERSQLDLFVNYILSRKLDVYLRKHDWAGFASRYNGPSYATYSYHTKLQAAYNKYKK